MAQRLLLAMVYTFDAAQPSAQAVVQSVLCIAFVVGHVIATPLRDRDSQTLQTVLLFCLAVVAVCGTPLAVLSESAQSASLSSSDSLVQRLRVAFGVVIPLLGIGLAYGYKPLAALASRVGVRLAAGRCCAVAASSRAVGRLLTCLRRACQLRQARQRLTATSTKSS